MVNAKRTEAVGVRCLAQGHLDTQLGGAGDRTSDLPLTSLSALPPEPHRHTPLHKVLASVGTYGSGSSESFFFFSNCSFEIILDREQDGRHNVLKHKIKTKDK